MSEQHRDPLEDGYDPRPPAGDGCPLDCAGGWVQVKEKYAEHLADQTAERGTPRWRTLRASHLNSYYPCRVHRPAQFFRWAGGHLNRDHDQAACPECLEAKGSTRKASAVKRATAGAGAAAARQEGE